MKRQKYKIGKTLFKTIRQPEKFSQGCTAKNSNSSFNSQHAFKGYESFCIVKILKSFKPEQELKDNESAIKKANIFIVWIKIF